MGAVVRDRDFKSICNLMLLIFTLLCTIPIRIGSIIDALFMMIRNGVLYLYKLCVIFITSMLLFTLCLPQIVVFCINDCVRPENCPEEIRGLSHAEYLTYIFNISAQNMSIITNPLFIILESMYSKFLLRQFTANLISSISTWGVQIAFRSLTLAEDFLSTSPNLIRIIFDSGASTNLVFYPLKGDMIVGSRKLNLAAGQTSTGNITVSGEVTLPQSILESATCTEELISMGRFAKNCGRVVWEGSTCDLYTRDDSGALQLLYKLEIERNCPIMSELQAKTIRELQRAKLMGQGFNEFNINSRI